MATSEEKQELVDALSGPRYYRILIQGYGGEAAYMGISKEAYEYWKPHTELHGDGDLVNYLISAEDGDYDFDEIDGELPPEAKFLYDVDGDYSSPWYEAPREFEHVCGASYDSANITVEEVNSNDYTATHVADVIDYMSVSELSDQVDQETDGDIFIVDFNDADATPDDVKYICQMYSSEKGCFFEAIIETVGDFDPKKLKMYATEFLNGEDTITSIEYDGVELDNSGGDTNGKGYYAAVWENK